MSVRSIGPRIPTAVDTALAAKDEMIERELALKGKFDSEIKRLSEIKAQAEERLAILGGAEQAKIVIEEAGKKAADMEAQAQAKLDAASSSLAEIAGREKASLAREHAVGARESELTAAQEALVAERARLDAQESERSALRAKREQELDRMAQRVADGEKALGAASRALAQREKAFNARLEALKITD